MADFPGKRILRYRVPVLEDGVRVWRSMEEVDTSDGAHPNWPDRFFAKIVDGFLAKTGNAGGWVGDAMTYILNARELFDFALPVMQAVAWNPRAAHSLRELERESSFGPLHR